MSTCVCFRTGGKTYSPISGQLVKKDSVEDIVNCMLSYPKGTRYTVLTPILPRDGRTVAEQLDMDMKQGFTRLEVDGEMVCIEDYTYHESDKVYLLVDRMSCDDSKDAISRLTDSAETAMYEGDGTCMLRFTCRTTPACMCSAPNLKLTASSLKNRTTKCSRSTRRWEPVLRVKASARLSASMNIW